MDPKKYVTIYTDPGGDDHQALQIPWADMDALLGHDHSGSAEDDKTLSGLLLKAGAPEWVKDAAGWTDEHGWGVIGPKKTLTLWDRTIGEETPAEQDTLRDLIKSADLHPGPYGYNGHDVDQVIYDGETPAAWRRAGAWEELPRAQAPFVDAELSFHPYDPEA